MTIRVRPLSRELAQKALVELNETPGKLEKGIRHLKEWIKQQPHLRARTDDQWLAAFLSGCKHNLERAKKKLDLYYSLRSISPDMYTFRPTDPKFRELLKTGAVLILPKLASPLDPRVILVRPRLYDPNKIVVTDFLSFSYILQQILYLEDDAFLVNGCINIIDLEGVTMAHFLQMTPTLIKKLVVGGQDASPLRLKGLYNINTLPMFEKLFNIVIKLVNAKHKSRIYVYGKNKRMIDKILPKDVLPAEYGGNGGTAQEIIDYWLKKIDEYETWLDEDMAFGTDESKRPVKAKTAAATLGIEGSFRKLEVD